MKKKSTYVIGCLTIISIVICYFGYITYKQNKETGIFEYNPVIDRQACVDIMYDDFFWLTEGYDKETYDFGGQLDRGVTRRHGKEVPVMIKVVRQHGKTAGFITFLSEKPECGTILLVCIKKEYRRLGLARQLIQSVLAYFRSLNYKLVKLDVRKTNVQAQSLYKKLGFQVYGEYQDSHSIAYACTL